LRYRRALRLTRAADDDDELRLRREAASRG